MSFEALTDSEKNLVHLKEELNERYVFKGFEAIIEDEAFLSKVNPGEIKNLHAGVLIHCILAKGHLGNPILKNVIGEPTAMADEALLEKVCEYLEEEE